MTNKNILIYPSNFQLHTYYKALFSNKIEGYDFILPEYKPNKLNFIKKFDFLRKTYRFMINNFGLYSLFNLLKGNVKTDKNFDAVFSMGVLYDGKEDYVIDILDNPYSLTGYNYELFINNLDKIQNKLSQKNCKKIICKNKDALKIMQKHFSKKILNKCQIIYPGINIKEYPIKEKFNEFTFLFIGSITNPEDFFVKGGVEAVRAFKKLKQENIKLIVRCKVPEIIRKEIEEDNRIKLIENQISLEELEDLYDKSHVFILPGHTFHLMVSLEAMNHSMPIICLDTFAFNDLVMDGKNGFKIRLLDNKDKYQNEKYPTNVRDEDFIQGIIIGNTKTIEKISEKMNYLINNRETSKIMGINSKKFLKSKFDIIKNNIELKKVFDKDFI